MKRKVLASLLVIAVVAGLVGAGTWAWFSDAATGNANTFTAGTLSIDNSLVTAAVAFTIPNMAPGDVTGEYVVTIKNDGTIDLAWLGDWQFTGSPALRDALYIDYAKMEFLAPTSGISWLDDATTGYGPGGGAATDTNGEDVFITNGVGSGPYPVTYNALAALSSFGVVTFNNWNNNAGMVPGSAYEHAGALKPTYSYKLTVKFGMAPGAGNGYQGLGPVTAKLQVNATQINSAALQLQGVPAATADSWTVPVTGWMNLQIADQTE